MTKDLIAATGNSLDASFTAAALGLHFAVTEGIPRIVNAWKLADILNARKEILDGIRRVWIVGMEIDPNLSSALNSYKPALEAYSLSNLEDSKSGARTLMASGIGKAMIADGRWKNLVQCALYADLQFSGNADAKEWSDSRAFAIAVDAYGRIPWKHPDLFLDEWKLLLQEEDAFEAMKQTGLAMCDHADAHLESQIRSNGGLLEFAGSKWICLNGSAGRLKGKDVASPAEHDGVLSWQWCPRQKAWRIFFESEGSADLDAVSEACADFAGSQKKPVRFRDRWLLAYLERMPFRLQDVKYFWKF